MLRITGDRPAVVMIGRILVVVACAAATLVSVAAVQHAAAASNDFQWSGARLLLHGRDPYQALFDGDRSAFAMTQFPNYTPLLYVLLLPLGAISLVHAEVAWACLNMAMFVTAVVLVARGVGLRGWPAVGFSALFFCSEPFCIALGGGQQTALVLFAAVLGMWAANEFAAGGAFGLMLVKYSFAPVALPALLGKRWTTVATAAAVELLGLVAFCLITGSGGIATLFAPLRAARLSQARGAGDVLSLTRVLVGNELVAWAVAIGFGVLLTWSARRVLGGSDWVDALACGSLISLLVFPHLVYDYCFLLPVLASGVRRRGWPRVALLAVVGVLMFGWFLDGTVVHVFEVDHSHTDLAGLVQIAGLLSVGLLVLVRSAGTATQPARSAEPAVAVA